MKNLLLLLSVGIFLLGCGVDTTPQEVQGESMDYTIISSNRSAETASFKVLIPAPPEQGEELPTAQKIYNDAGPGTMSLYDTVKIEYYMPTMDYSGLPGIIAYYEKSEWYFDVPEQRINFDVDSREELIEFYWSESERIEAQRALQEKIDSQFSAWDGSHIELVKMIKKSMNDADSFEHIETRYVVNEDQGMINVLMSFRGNNAFGAKVLNTIEAEIDLESGEVLSAHTVE